MKCWMYLLLLVLLSFGCKNKTEKQAILETYDANQLVCDSLTKKAKLDFKNGIREYTRIGHITATEFEVFYSDFMKKNYNITMKASDAPSYPWECYALSMNYEIEYKYGKDFIERTRDKAESEFDNKSK